MRARCAVIRSAFMASVRDVARRCRWLRKDSARRDRVHVLESARELETALRTLGSVALEIVSLDRRESLPGEYDERAPFGNDRDADDFFAGQQPFRLVDLDRLHAFPAGEQRQLVRHEDE